MNKYRNSGLAAVMAGAALASGCGGGEPTYEDLRREAEALRAQAVAQVQPDPCASDNECTGLVFRYPYHTCDQHDQHTYATRSPGAATAEGLAERQREAAIDAIKKSRDGVGCPAWVEPPPRHVCVAGRCEQRHWRR